MATEHATKSGSEWFQAQQPYWDAWFQAQRNFFDQQNKGAPGLQGKWNELFNEWRNLTSANGVGGAENYSNAFAKAGKTYLDMLEQFFGATLGTQAPEETLKVWMESLQTFFSNTLQQNSQPFDSTTAFKTFTDSLGGGPGAWANMFKAPLPGEEHPHHATAFLFDPFGFYASVPGIGYTREKQEHLNLLYRLWVDYEGQTRRYNAEMTKVGLQALKKFQDYIFTSPEGAKPLESLKDVYVKFVDVSEEVFAAYALTEEYTKMYGEVVNALMAFKKQLHVVTDDAMEQLNLPNRQEIDSLHRRTHELRRENHQLRKDIAELKAALGLGAKPKAPAQAKAAPAPAPAPAKKSAPKAKAKPAKKPVKQTTKKKAGKK